MVKLSTFVLIAAVFVWSSDSQLWNYNNYYRSCSSCNPYGTYGSYGGYNNMAYRNPYTQPYGYAGGVGGGMGGLGMGLGGAAACRDRSPNCAYLVSMGECATNPIATRTMCPISCGTGCTGLGAGGAGMGMGIGLGTMDALADNSVYTNPLLYNSISPYGGIYRKQPSDNIPHRPVEKL